MTTTEKQYRKQGSTEPEEFQLSATGLTDLSALSQAVLYMRRLGGTTVNKVDGAALTVVDSAARLIQFDPAGAAVGGGDAFDEPGIFGIYIRATWSDAGVTRHPDEGYLEFEIQPNYE